MDLPELGKLSEKYESRGDSAAIGWDHAGGASYGRYQIATKVGTMDLFMTYLAKEDPMLYAELNKYRDTMFDKHGPFAQQWKTLANKGLLKAHEHEFIKRTHYDRAIKDIALGPLTLVNKYNAVQQVLWSTAVQHGPRNASKIFNRAWIDNISARQYIEAIYEMRGRYLGRLKQKIRAAVLQRFRHEVKDALEMLNNEVPIA